MDLLCSANQTVTLDFASYGDGGHCHYLFTYLPSLRPRLRVCKLREAFLPPPHPQIQLSSRSFPPLPLAEVLLTPAQVQRLVNRLRDLRIEHKGWCTQITSVAVRWEKAGCLLAQEYHLDKSGATDICVDAHPRDLRALRQLGGRWATIGELPVLDLRTVAQQAEAAHQKGLPRVAFRELPRKETGAAKELAHHRKEQQARAAAEKRLHRLPGFARLDAQYTLSHFAQGNYMVPREGDALYLVLTPRTKGRIDAFDWYIPLVHGKPNLTGEAFLRQAKRLTDSVASLDWLDGWRQAAPGRTIEATLYGESFLNPDTFSDDPHTLWKTAGLPGSLFAVLTLRRADYTYLNLAVAPQERRTLVVLQMLPRSEKELVAHPLDSLGKAKAIRGFVREPFLLNAQGHP